jgi:hypothetical protein
LSTIFHVFSTRLSLSFHARLLIFEQKHVQDRRKKGKTAMKKNLIITLTIALLSSVLCSACSQNSSGVKVDGLNTIRHATVLITVQAPNSDQSTEGSTFLAFGVGSLIEYQGEILLVTHNHWRTLQDATLVKFYDADNHLLKVIIKQRFVESIVYADAGTLILRPPQELIDQLVPVSVQEIPQVATGETVEIVYRENPSREIAAIKQAVVEEVAIYNNEPVYKLRSLDGQTIQPGDSGGGIWYDGCLVGNNWTVTARSTTTPEESVEENLIYIDTSFGAILPAELP